MQEIILYGADWCSKCHALREKLDQKSIKYTYKNVDESEIGEEHLHLAGSDIPEGKKGIPTLKIGESIAIYPDDTWLAEHIDGFAQENSSEKIHDVLMVGAGPASLAAAIYTTREDLETVLYEKGAIGGLASTTDWVDNYPGFPDGISGMDLGDNLRKQAERFGADIQLGEVSKINKNGNLLEVDTTDGLVKAKSVLIATGSDYKRLGIPGEEEFYARGVHFCATCDGAFYRDKKLVVVGGGNSAIQESMFLTKFASKIDILVRGTELRASDVLQHELDKFKDKITVHFNTTTDEIIGADSKLTGVKATKDGQKTTFETDGVFIFIGLLPNTGFLKDSGIELDEIGMIKTDDKLMTSIPGVFCAGDVRSGATMQIASAIGEGATAALRIREYIVESSR